MLVCVFPWLGQELLKKGHFLPLYLQPPVNTQHMETLNKCMNEWVKKCMNDIYQGPKAWLPNFITPQVTHDLTVFHNWESTLSEGKP